MGLLESAARRLLKDELIFSEIASRQQSSNYELLKERIAELELALEDTGWLRLGDETLDEFSRDGLRTITRLGRLFFLKNPLVQRGIKVQMYYVWAQGMSVKARQPKINDLIQSFMEDEKNRVELTDHQARMMKEKELQTDGNLFFVFFTDKSTGRVRLRTMPFGEIDDVIRNPEDSKEPWYYQRSYVEQQFTPEGGLLGMKQITEYYPDWQYNPATKPATINRKECHWDRPVYHIKVGGFSDWKFGVSEVYASIDWARAYKEFLEDWASITRAYRRFAFKMTGLTSKAEIAASKAKLQTTYASGGGISEETQPPPVTGAVAYLKGDRDLQPVRTAGATVSAEDGRRILLMVASAVGLPETFFGDVSVGTLATAKSLDRPTELAMLDRQQLWANIHEGIFDYALLQAVKAPSGPLRGLGKIVEDKDDGNIRQRVEWNEGVDSWIDIDFPPLIESDVEKMIMAIVDAATLKGLPLAGTIPAKDVSRMILSALGEPDVDELLEILFPEDGEEPEWEGEEIADAIHGFREAMEKLVEKYATSV